MSEQELTGQEHTVPDLKITCTTCEACCCRLEVMILTETGVPAKYIVSDKWGGSSMERLDDGWCAALDRNTMLCTIYERRPLVCREFEAGEYECIIERKQMVRVSDLA